MTIEQNHQVRHFNTDAAMQLVDAFYRQESLPRLLALLHRQLGSLACTTGLEYGRRSDDEDTRVDEAFGVRRKHRVRYNLRWPEQDLGFLTLFFDRPAADETLETAEDLITLASGALHAQLRVERDRPLEPAVSSAAAVIPQKQPVRPDSLVLLEIDDFEALIERHGPAWALAVTQSLQAVISDLLRDQDSVFQVEAGQLAVLLPKTETAGAEAVAQKICVLVGTLHLSGNDVEQQLTACMGLASSRPDDSASDVLVRARHALTSAQLEGPNAISLGSLRLVGTGTAR